MYASYIWNSGGGVAIIYKWPAFAIAIMYGKNSYT
jgi:hypothetical protein